MRETRVSVAENKSVVQELDDLGNAR